MKILLSSTPPASSTVSCPSAACAVVAAHATSTAIAVKIALCIAESSSLALPWHYLGEQHDLADVAALGDEFVRLPGPVEGERLGDHRLQLARLEVGHQGLGDAVEVALAVPPAQHVEPEDALVLVHQEEALPPGHSRQRHLRHALQRRRRAADAAVGVPRESVHDQPPARAQQ